MIKTDVKGFAERLKIPNYEALFHIIIKDDKVIRIEEQYVP